jgi:hypothetical protein
MNQFFTNNELNENSLRNEILKLTGVYCNLNSLPVPDVCKPALESATPEELLEAEIKLVDSQYRLEE